MKKFSKLLSILLCLSFVLSILSTAVFTAGIVAGDLTGDGSVTREDAIHLLYHSIYPDSYTVNQSVDYVADGETTREDAIYLLYHSIYPEDYPLNVSEQPFVYSVPLTSSNIVVGNDIASFNQDGSAYVETGSLVAWSIPKVMLGGTVTVTIKGSSAGNFRVWLLTDGEGTFSNQFKSADLGFNGGDFKYTFKLTAADVDANGEICANAIAFKSPSWDSQLNKLLIESVEITYYMEKEDVPRDAAEVARDMGLGISLGNTFEAYYGSDGNYEWPYKIGKNTPLDYERCWGAVTTTQEVINGMRDCGFNTVRIPVFWGNMMENDGTWTINPEYLARIKEIVDYCENAGVYSVINIHHFDEFIIRRNDLESCEKIFTKLWTQIAECFKDYPYTVVFEGFNEYIGGDQFNNAGQLVAQGDEKAYRMAKVLNQAFVDAVRSTGNNNADRVLIVSGYWTNIDKTTSERFIMPTDTAKNKLMISVHYVDNSMYWGKKIGTQEWLNYIDDQCNKLDRAFTKKGIPVFMGETSGGYPQENFGNNAIHKKSSECLEIVLRELIDRGYVPVIWDTNDDFYSRTKYVINDKDNAKVISNILELIK